MTMKYPDRRLLLKKVWPRGVGVYEINELDDADTIRIEDFDSGETIETATIVNAENGATVTQGAIATNVLTVNDATMNDSRVWIFVIGVLTP